MLESSFNDLYLSAVAAFPGTTKRQYAVEPIRIVEMRWTPFVGLRTLFVKGRAQNEGKQYSPIMLFKNVEYGSGEPLIASDGIEYFLEKVSFDDEINLRCDCGDFYWRFNYYDHLDKSLYGRKRAKYEAKTNRPPANPKEMPGMCKHLMKLMLAIQDSGITV